MKARSRLGALGGAVSGYLLVLACSTASGPRPTGEAARSSLPDLASMLSGRFRGTTPGNELALDLSTLGARAGTRFDVLVTVSGRYHDTNVRRVGLLRLEMQGRDVRAVYVPHFDSTVTPLSREATRFTEEELRAACSLYFHPSGDGYVGETPGPTTCAQALPGAVGKWTVEVDPAGIRVRNVETGETLRFAKAA
ncbi:MAG TPA: hypothetical protein VGS98_02455 [Thermoanaerobaculia bacterium]|nr:hypothetical protein [Thermoanaerobaculia bacterium]